MSRTRRRVPGWMLYLDTTADSVGEHFQYWDPSGWWQGLRTSFIRGHRPGKEARKIRANGGHWGTLDIPGRSCAASKRFYKQQATRLRRRLAKQQLDDYA